MLLKAGLKRCKSCFTAVFKYEDKCNTKRNMKYASHLLLHDSNF